MLGPDVVEVIDLSNDRTDEFFKTVSSFAKQLQPQLQNHLSISSDIVAPTSTDVHLKRLPPGQRSKFSESAAQVARGIAQIAEKLELLAKCRYSWSRLLIRLMAHHPPMCFSGKAKVTI